MGEELERLSEENKRILDKIVDERISQSVESKIQKMSMDVVDKNKRDEFEELKTNSQEVFKNNEQLLKRANDISSEFSDINYTELKTMHDVSKQMFTTETEKQKQYSPHLTGKNNSIDYSKEENVYPRDMTELSTMYKSLKPKSMLNRGCGIYETKNPDFNPDEFVSPQQFSIMDLDNDSAISMRQNLRDAIDNKLMKRDIQGGWTDSLNIV